MPHWFDELADELKQREQVKLHRQLRIADPDQQGKYVRRDGQLLLNLAGNDYLALSQHPRLIQAAKEAIDNFGVGSGASRLVTGHQSLHEKFESRFAAFKHAESALLFPTGYMANLGMITTLARKDDLVCMDKLNHASLIDAGRSCETALRIYPHLQVEKLSRLLQEHQQNQPEARRFIVTDSVFSMDGDVADLPRLLELAEQYDACLVVDEAHGTGVLGETGTGLAEAQGVSEALADRGIIISTLSKALAGLGGVVTARRVVIETLINQARSLIYTTASPSAIPAAALAGLDVIRDEPQRRDRLRELAGQLRAFLMTHSSLRTIQPANELQTPIIPAITGDATSALRLAEHLKQQGILAPAIRPPTVAANECRVRFSLRADLTQDDLTRVMSALESYL